MAGIGIHLYTIVTYGCYWIHLYVPGIIMGDMEYSFINAADRYNRVKIFKELKRLVILLILTKIGTKFCLPTHP